MFNNLGINKNRHMFNENVDFNMNGFIEQGIEFEKYGQKYYSDNEHALLGNTSSPFWGSIVEAFNGEDSAQPFGTEVDLPSVSLVDATQFNNLVSNYATTHKTYSSAILGTHPPIAADRSSIEKDLQSQHDRIISEADEINDQMKSNAETEAALRAANRYNQGLLNQKMNNLVQQNSTVGVLNDKYDSNTVIGALETTGLNMNSNYYHFLVYFIVSITLISFTFNMLANPNANVLNAIYVIVGLLAVYLVSRYYAL
jgi:hypothetical protein